MAEIDCDDDSTWAAIRPQRCVDSAGGSKTRPTHTEGISAGWLGSGVFDRPPARANENLGANGRSSPVAHKVAFGHATPATPPKAFVWTKNAEDILENVAGTRKALHKIPSA